MPSEMELGECQREGEWEAEMLSGPTRARHHWGGEGSSITSLERGVKELPGESGH